MAPEPRLLFLTAQRIVYGARLGRSAIEVFGPVAHGPIAKANAPRIDAIEVLFGEHQRLSSIGSSAAEAEMVLEIAHSVSSLGRWSNQTGVDVLEHQRHLRVGWKSFAALVDAVAAEVSRQGIHADHRPGEDLECALATPLISSGRSTAQPIGGRVVAQEAIVPVKRHRGWGCCLIR